MVIKISVERSSRIGSIDPRILENYGARLDEYVLKECNRLMYPGRSKKMEAGGSQGRLAILIEYLLNFDEEMKYAAIPDKTRIGQGDLVAVFGGQCKLGIVDSVADSRYHVYPIPLAEIETVTLDDKRIRKIAQMNSPDEVIIAGNRVTVPEIYRYQFSKHAGQVRREEVRHMNPCKNYTFYYANKVLIGHRNNTKFSTHSEPMDRFIFCEPKTMKKADTYVPAQGMLIQKLLDETGLKKYFRDIIELDNISRNLSTPLLTSEERMLLGLLYDEIRK